MKEANFADAPALKSLIGNKLFISKSYQLAMQSAGKAILVCVIALSAVVAVPLAVIVAKDFGLPTPFLGTVIGGLLLGAYYFLARANDVQRSALPSSTPSARWLEESRLALGDTQQRRPASAPVILLLVATPVLQWAFLVYWGWSRIDVASGLVCVAIGIAGMSAAAIWNLRRNDVAAPPLLKRPPWRVLVIGVAGLSLIAFEALTKHSFLATAFALLIVDALFLRLLILCFSRPDLLSR